MDEVYGYLPLDHANGTRMLELNPGKDSDPLSCKLRHVDLEDHPPYEALSYQWGNPERDHRISVGNGSYIPITKSLHSALCDLRQEDTPRTIWADAICINQDDIIERQQQVAIMGAIYSKAKQVVTYAGPEDEGSAMAIELANEIMEGLDTSSRQAEAGRPSEHRLRQIEAMSPSDPRCVALRAFILRGWSGRIWCAQEFLLNRNLVVMCGRKTIGWAAIPDIILWSYRRVLPNFVAPNQNDDPLDKRECLLQLSDLRNRSVGSISKLPFAELLAQLHSFQASDPRDKMFAILSLCEDASDIAVDYDCSVQQLYTRVATKIITESSTLQVLYHNLGRKEYDVPSWVPDWSTWRVGSRAIFNEEIHLACGPTTCEFEIQSLVKLAAVGCLVDQIEEVGDPIGPYYLYIRVPGHGPWLQRQEELARKTTQYPQDSAASEAMTRALISSEVWAPNRRGQGGDLGLAYTAHKRPLSENSPEEEALAVQFVHAVRRRSRYRRLGLSKRGFLGAVPAEAEAGDWICMIHGMKMPFVIRPVGTEFRLVGHAYVDGLMTGKILELDWYEKRVITLI